MNEFIEYCYCNKLTFNTKGEFVVALNKHGHQISYDAAKKRWQRNSELKNKINNLIKPQIIGAKAYQHSPSVVDIIEDIRKEYRKAEQYEQQKQNQSITFNERYVCLVNMSDIHFGPYCDIDRLFSETEVVLNTPGMYVNFLGDLTDNFIGDWTLPINLNYKITPKEQFQIAVFWLNMIRPKLIAFTSGNHDLWTAETAGIDILQHELSKILPEILYDEHENIFDLRGKNTSFTVKTRHKWSGSSRINPTYGIERGYAHNPFDIGVGGHTHISGLYREFLGINGKTSVAVLCGAYKRIDSYARELGFPKPNHSASVCVIMDTELHKFYGISDVYAASKVMRALNK